MHLYKSFSKNEAGSDYVVGDIHGCFDMLDDLLKEAGFNTETDRLFSVGDLVDRGPKCPDVVRWIARPWFHAVSGNHDDLAVRIHAGTADVGLHIMNGGAWMQYLDEDERSHIAKHLAALPVCIDVETDRGLVGIVHADILGTSWSKFVHGLLTATSKSQRYDYMEAAMWSRDRIRHKLIEPVEDLYRMYVGHTPVDNVTNLANVFYVDTGACFGRQMTMVCIQGKHAGEVFNVKHKDAE